MLSIQPSTVNLYLSLDVYMKYEECLFWFSDMNTFILYLFSRFPDSYTIYMHNEKGCRYLFFEYWF